ncbi:DUF6801 domain-containing protein [Streptomyces sp. NPDC057743]|uniref:DUF6801 domain-containing protein n=1 Tax=Streptomyces sp. NPDC057743 TaxID=3346236 RepID=UPI0036848488
MRIILAVATATATASGLVGIIGAGSASAQPLSRTFGYTCAAGMLGNQPFTVEIDSDAPRSFTVGAPRKTIAVNAVATVSAGFTQWLAQAHMKTLGGTVQATAHVAAPQDDFDVTVPFHVATTSVPASGPFKVRATASPTTRTFNHPGKGTVTAGGLTLALLAKNAAGTVALAGNAACTLNPDQSNFVTSFDVTKPVPAPPTPPGSSTGPGPGASAAPRPATGSAGAAVPKPAPSAGAGHATHSPATPSNPGASPSHAPSAPPVTHPSHTTPRSTAPAVVVKTSTGGRNTRDLVLLAVGVLVAMAASFGLGALLKNRRHTSGDGAARRSIDPKQGLLIEGVKTHSTDVSYPEKGLHAAVPQRRGHDGGTAAHGHTGRRVTEGQNLLLGRHVPRQASHRGVGARNHGGTDPHTQLPGSSQGEGIDVVADEQSHDAAYVRQG